MGDSIGALPAVEALCHRMWRQPRLSDADIARRAEEHMQRVWRQVEAGQPVDEATLGVLGFLAQPEGQARLQAIAHDLGAQTRIVDGLFSEYLERGQVPAPHFAMRVAELLAEAGHARHEMAFLAAWCKHFGHVRNGTTATKLAERARALGVYR